MKEFRINMNKNSDKKLENAKMLIKDCCKILIKNVIALIKWSIVWVAA